MSDLTEQAVASNAWPFLEAANILKRIGNKTPDKGYVLFETGYGPSGLPHIGTFGEVARTTMVRRAFELLAPNIPTKLFCVSDDMDGLRKIPDNLPNPKMIEANLGKALTSIPDPFETHESFGAHMNNRLQQFLNQFGFDYEFKSATENYKSGAYDDKLMEVLRNFDKVMSIMIPTLGQERQQTYSPFMPICVKTGQVLQVPTLETHPDKGTIIYEDLDGERVETPVTGGHCKLQWKPDWGMRWAALGVDYEMYGKDLLPTAQTSGKICRAIGGVPPEQFMYELFLDEKGEKISKSKGNGLTMDEWLRYAPQQSLSYYMYQSPRKAKRLYFDVIPKAVDEYLNYLGKFCEQPAEEQFKNPTWHIHGGTPPKPESPLTFALLLNLASACHAEEASILWGFITNYAADATPQNAPHLDELVKHALNYYQDFIKPNKQYRAPDEKEKAALKDLAIALERMPQHATAEELQNQVYAIGKEHEFENLRDWFCALYEVLLGQSQGPRFGSFIELYGKDATVELIRRVLKGENLAA